MVLSFQSLFMSRLILLNSICFNKGKKVEKRFSETSRKSVRAVVSYSCHYLITSFLLLLLPLPQYLIINKSPPSGRCYIKKSQSFNHSWPWNIDWIGGCCAGNCPAGFSVTCWLLNISTTSLLHYSTFWNMSERCQKEPAPTSSIPKAEPFSFPWSPR